MQDPLVLSVATYLVRREDVRVRLSAVATEEQEGDNSPLIDQDRALLSLRLGRIRALCLASPRVPSTQTTPGHCRNGRNLQFRQRPRHRCLLDYVRRPEYRVTALGAAMLPLSPVIRTWVLRQCQGREDCGGGLHWNLISLMSRP